MQVVVRMKEKPTSHRYMSKLVTGSVSEHASLFFLIWLEGSLFLKKKVEFGPL